MSSRFLSPDNRWYVAWRKIRYLARRGTLFTLPLEEDGTRIDLRKGTFPIIMANSLALFLLGYLVIYLLSLFITAFVAKLYDIPVLVFYNEVDFLIRGIDWTADMVEGVFSASPIALFILSLFLLILYFNVAVETGILRLLVLWMFFHTVTRLFGEILVGSLMNRGFGYVILYLFIMDTAKVVISIMVFVVMFILGLLMFRSFMYSANTYFNDLRRSYRVRFILSQFIYPFLIGNGIILLIKIPDFSYFDAALNFTGALMFIPFLVRSVSFPDMYFDEDPKEVRLRGTIILVTILAIILFRVILGFGIRV